MKTLKMLCIMVLVAGLASFAFAEEVKRNAEIIAVRGEVQVKLLEEGKWIPTERKMILGEGDIIKTKSDSWAMLKVDKTGDTATVELEENSQLLLAELVKDEEKGTQRTLLDLAIGEILIRAKKLHTPESKFEVKTPTSVVGVRGTKFSVRVEALE